MAFVLAATMNENTCPSALASPAPSKYVVHNTRLRIFQGLIDDHLARQRNQTGFFIAITSRGDLWPCVPVAPQGVLLPNGGIALQRGDDGLGGSNDRPRRDSVTSGEVNAVVSPMTYARLCPLSPSVARTGFIRKVEDCCLRSSPFVRSPADALWVRCVQLC